MAKTITNRPHNKLSNKKIKEMYQAFKERATIGNIVNKCGVHHITARRYIEKYGWREKIREIEKKVLEKDIDREVKRRLDNLEVVRTAIRQIYLKIRRGEMGWNSGDLDKMIRLEADILSNKAGTQQQIHIEIYNDVIETKDPKLVGSIEINKIEQDKDTK